LGQLTVIQVHYTDSWRSLHAGLLDHVVSWLTPHAALPGARPSVLCHLCGFVF
jgi:hypothetical protein